MKYEFFDVRLTVKTSRYGKVEIFSEQNIDGTWSSVLSECKSLEDELSEGVIREIAEEVDKILEFGGLSTRG